MLLIHQTGSVKVGEVVRYTLTYTPSRDRILPSPTHLHVRIKNTSPIPLRAAFVHGPYSLHVSAYPSTFNPHKKADDAHDQGVPEFEPLLKAGAHWTCKLQVPERIRQTGGESATSTRPTAHDDTSESKSATWIIEVASQILFSSTASVNYEILVGRDDRSLALGFVTAATHGHGGPGRVQDHKFDASRPSGQTRGVYSKAVKLIVEDTNDLWDKPKLPSTEGRTNNFKLGDMQDCDKGVTDQKQPKSKKRKVHLVVLSHGIHGNLSADMLFLKESIDATVKQANQDRRRRKAAARSGATLHNQQNTASTAPLSGGQDTPAEDIDADDSDDELTIVRGFTGNAIKTEKGIQYLGKRLAKYVLHATYPDQPYVPMKNSRSFTNRFKDHNEPLNTENDKLPVPGSCAPSVHSSSHIHRDDSGSREVPYTFTSISFIGHSLGGLIQTYAIAYIQKHAPGFFSQIKPVNFICLASPLLGLSHENPMYVKFALDFGLVGRTGQDLGLTWRAPTLAKSGWSAVVSGLTPGPRNSTGTSPGAKPLLRVLPTGPAHQVLRLFRNRTLYSNVVNDGVVPLRTSCLLFLDWKGLGKVDKTRRDNGLIGTVAEWGWAELTGASAADPGFPHRFRFGSSSGTSTPTTQVNADVIPQPPDEATSTDGKFSSVIDVQSEQFLSIQRKRNREDDTISAKSPNGSIASVNSHTSSFLDNIFGFFKPHPDQGPKSTRAIRRGQTLPAEPTQEDLQSASSSPKETMESPTLQSRPGATRGDSVEHSMLSAPPRTSIFEAAGDILHPPLPPSSWINDPSSRKQTIFHDRIYHPEDIPQPPIRTGRQGRSLSSDAATPQRPGSSRPQTAPDQYVEYSRMKVEERIARAYHRDLSWRKVLVSLEPDAHNNMIVRRMFANAYGWPVVKHLCDTHFADSWSAQTRDENEPGLDRAAQRQAAGEGEEVVNQLSKTPPAKVDESDMRRVADELKAATTARPPRPPLLRTITDGISYDSEVWDDVYFDGGTDEETEDEGIKGAVSRLFSPAVLGGAGEARAAAGVLSKSVQSLSPLDGHRGLGPLDGGAHEAAQTAKMAEGLGLREHSALLGDAVLTEEPQSLHDADRQ